MSTGTPDRRVAEHAAAIAAISAADPDFAEFIGRAGTLQERPGQGDHFTALARAIVFQQLAGRAATAIYNRTVAAVGGRMTPQALLTAPDDSLRAAGLSGSKTAALLDLAAKSVDGTLSLDELPALGDDEIVSRLVTVRGIGRWTAEMFLIFELRRPDVWPVDDLGVRHGWTLIHRLPQLVRPSELASAGDPLRPHRTTAALYCWQAVHIERGELAPRADSPPPQRVEPDPGSPRQADR
jgi:DNA-3-methyladenine glycosylase II